MKYTIVSVETEDQLAVVDLLETGDGSSWSVSGASFPGAKVRVVDGMLGVSVVRGSCEERFVFPVCTQNTDGALVVSTALGSFKLLAQRGVISETAGGSRSLHKAIKSSMPGKVVKVLCKPGDTIEAGQPILIIEAMKMENEITAPHGGVVEEIPVQPGQSVQSGELLVRLGQKLDKKLETS